MRVLILGASGHGRVIADAILSRNDHVVVGFVDAKYPESGMPLSRPLLGSDVDLSRIVSEHTIEGIVVAIGDNWTRARIVERLTSEFPRLQFPPVVHASAVIAPGVSIAAGSVVMAGAILNPGVVIAPHVIVNTGACVDHDSTLGAYSSVAPRVACGGAVVIGNFAAIGIGATIIHGLNIGEHVVLGAGAVAVSSISAYSVAMGVPAKVMRHRSAGEPYL